MKDEENLILERNLTNFYEKLIKFNLQEINHTELEDHFKYKYLLSIDGWTAAWGRLPWILNSNSLLVKHNSTKVQWFYGEMIENYHYMSLNDFNESLVEFYEWA